MKKRKNPKKRNKLVQAEKIEYSINELIKLGKRHNSIPLAKPITNQISSEIVTKNTKVLQNAK